MSLHVDDSARRGRDSSSDRRRSARGSSPSLLDAVRMPSPPAGFSYDDEGPRRERAVSYRVGSPTEESSHWADPRRKSVERVSSSASASSSRGNRDMVEAAQDALRRGAETFLPAKYASKLRETEDEKAMKKERKKEKLEDDLAYGTAVVTAPAPPPAKYHSPTSSSSRVRYDMPGGWEDDKERLRYPRVDTSYAPPLPDRPGKRDSYGRDPRASGPRIMTAEPGLTPGFGGRREHLPLQPERTSSLTVNTGHHSAMSLSNAPASPLLESYYGTYQSMSPMPSPLLLAQESPRNSDYIEPLSPSLSDGESNNGEKKRRRARFNDPVDDAARLAKALKGEHSPPDTEPLIEILPGMTHDQIMELRVEYKRLVKTGAERKGVNIAKHIRARLKDEDPTLMKACYTVALGKWESEAYWANFWYHGDKTRRELLIESLMGRSNYEIAQIKEAFSDKKYRDSLTLCMKTELKEDKFKRAVLMVLDEKRMEDIDEYGRPRAVDRDLVQDDVEALYKAVRSDRGGESAMIQIVVSRSDNHMKEVLRLYEKVVGSNFARDALKKSGNLVGELLAHILNGVINKPVRDALLLHHALTASRKDHLRRELLISRLVRFHWDRHHMAAIKRAYRERYGEELSEAVKEGTSGEWGLFCEQLVVTRMPDDVKSFEKVDAVREIRRSEERERERDREERLREREREMDRESDKERGREERHRRRKEEREDKDRKDKKERRREKEKEKDRSEGLLVVKDSKHRDRSRSRERSRSQRRE
ncbi:Annexin [Annulohypoxylon truncatum]|uniref:Annexin n=1 Tax=Annulohypoxylon truncatum TaxID=327061 RepID=UPI00200756DC|nr:Annexin [Annulohypoxylon truncatum]KAI1212722.1 Annexin [Annulohypoxylon truncatum]